MARVIEKSIIGLTRIRTVDHCFSTMKDKKHDSKSSPVRLDEFSILTKAITFARYRNILIVFWESPALNDHCHQN